MVFWIGFFLGAAACLVCLYIAAKVIFIKGDKELANICPNCHKGTLDVRRYKDPKTHEFWIGFTCDLCSFTENEERRQTRLKVR